MTLFTRSFLLIALLILASAGATVQLYRVYEREPREDVTRPEVAARLKISPRFGP